MATALRAKARHSERRAAEVTGDVTCETLRDGRYVVVSATTYRGEAQRQMAIANAIDWAAQNGERRAVNNYRNADQRQRHEQVYPAPLSPDGEWEYEEHDAAALAQFLRDETGLAWRIGSDMHGRRAVDLMPPAEPRQEYYSERTMNEYLRQSADRTEPSVQ